MRNDYESNYLAHYGILGMKWGVRRYQNTDGSLTPAGKKRYGEDIVKGGPVSGQINRSNKMREKSGISTTYENNQRVLQEIKDNSRSISQKTKNILKSDSGSKSSKARKEAREKNIDELSTEELKKINNRLNEEKRYQDLTKGTTAEGKKFVSELGRNIATGIITGIAIEVGKKFVKAKLGI